MKIITIVFLILLSSSCKKEKYTTDSLFLENLKETSSFYREEGEKISYAIAMRYQELEYKSGKFDTLKSITKRLDIFFSDLKTKSKSEKIVLQERFIREINDMNSEFKLTNFEVKKLEVLDNESLFYYLKTEFYKNQLDNYTKHYSKLPVYCGYKKYSKKKEELIQNSDIE